MSDEYNFKVRDDLKTVFDKDTINEFKKMLGRQLELLSEQSEKTKDINELCRLSHAIAKIVSIYPLSS